ncbi:MAG: hypothetical protein JNK92_13610 [Dechloromonas sp.]|nr:hypothetical protein [Dechloromonas sp.]
MKNYRWDGWALTQGRLFPKNLRAIRLLLGHTKLEGTVRFWASKSMMLWKSPSRPGFSEARTFAPCWCEWRLPGNCWIRASGQDETFICKKLVQC